MQPAGSLECTHICSAVPAGHLVFPAAPQSQLFLCGPLLTGMHSGPAEPLVQVTQLQELGS